MDKLVAIFLAMRDRLQVSLQAALSGCLKSVRARSEISCAFGRRIRDAMLGAKRAVWLCHTSDSQQRSAPEAGESNVQLIPERALRIKFQFGLDRGPVGGLGDH